MELEMAAVGKTWNELKLLAKSHLNGDDGAEVKEKPSHYFPTST